jgi:hypothetical protein
MAFVLPCINWVTGIGHWQRELLCRNWRIWFVENVPLASSMPMLSQRVVWDDTTPPPRPHHHLVQVAGSVPPPASDLKIHSQCACSRIVKACTQRKGAVVNSFLPKWGLLTGFFMTLDSAFLRPPWSCTYCAAVAVSRWRCAHARGRAN